MSIQHMKKVILGRDFNSEICKNCMGNFMYQHNLQSINKEPSCYKKPSNPSCIDLFVINSPRSFYQTEISFTGLSDFHKLFLSIFKTAFTKSKAKEDILRNSMNNALIMIFVLNCLLSKSKVMLHLKIFF